MIQSFRHKGLRDLFRSGSRRGIPPEFGSRLSRMLDVLDAAARPEDINLPGFHFHRLHAPAPRFTVRVSGNWRLTFGWHDAHAADVDLEDYH